MEHHFSKEGIAIVGIGLRFPGEINDVESLWKLLAEGREAVSEVPADRWNIERYYDAEPGLAGKSIAKRGGFLGNLENYDPQFFGISPREAPFIDPQQRLLLETAWEAIEDAGMVLDLDQGTDLAVFIGISHNDYQVIQGTPWDSSGISPHSPTGSAHSIAANRISYSLNLHGPSVAMDTACSSALTAVHAACEHLWNKRGRAALAGGVTVMITPGGFIGFSQASMLSPDGRCKAFDASANGFVRGEGAGVVLLKRLSDAMADGDNIQGVILGTCINQDGHTNGISLPSPEAQARLVKDACRDAGIDPVKIGFVEAHGTGTAVGDPIEAHALADALCQDRPVNQPLPIGSVKTNLGHLETAAGIAGLAKAVAVLKHQQIPASLHFENPNPNIDFDALKLRVPSKLEPFPANDGPRIVGVNSFGFGGANAHVIVAEAPPLPKADAKLAARPGPWPIVLSARSEEALRANALQLSAWLDQRLRANGTSSLLPSLVYTLGARRNHHQHRLTLVAQTAPEVVQELHGFASGQQGPKLRSAFTPRREQAPRIGFVMSGQGPQWWGMGRELMQHEPVFRQVMEQCAAAMEPYADFSLLEELARDETATNLHRTEIAQPAIFAMQMALAELWKSWGVTPHAITGHSVGEIAAACVAGVLTLEEASRLIVLRARFMGRCARGAGTMLAVGTDHDAARAVAARYNGKDIIIAAHNGPRSLTLAGPRTELESIAKELDAAGVFARFVRVDHPFHHPLMQPAARRLEEALAELKPRREVVPFFSTVTGLRCKGEDCTADHWGRGIKQPVLFSSAVDAMADHGVDVWLEISAHPALATSIQECLASREGARPAVVSSTRREQELENLLIAAMDLHLHGAALNFAAMTPSRRLLSLPAYSWDRSRWWNESPDWREGRLGKGGRGLLEHRTPRAMPTWVGRLDERHMAFLRDHKVENHIVFPAAAYVDMVLEAGVQFFEGRPFVIEDFEIRKPLLLQDPPTGLMLEITFDPVERTFSLQSRMEHAASWSVHVVGAMRAERTDAAFAQSQWRGLDAPDFQRLEVDDFYNHMSSLGLRYGDEFRGVTELAAGVGESAGKVRLSKKAAARAADYPLHPVLMDGALHVFSAAAKTVEDRKARMKLPVRFGRILYLRSPGAKIQAQARIHQFNDEFIEGSVALYDDKGQPCVLVDGFRAISMAAARRGGVAPGVRDLIYHVDWERTAVSGPPVPLAQPPLMELREAAHEALEAVLAVRGRARLEAAMAAEDDLARALVAQGLLNMDVQQGASFNADTLGITPGMRKVFDRFTLNLAKHGLLREGRRGWVPTAAFTKCATAAPQKLRAFLGEHPGHLPDGLLCQMTCAELGPILRGEKDAVQVLFSGAGSDLLEQFYGDGLLSSHWMASIASAVAAAASQLPEGRGLRILEVGAGTGGLSATVLPTLRRGLHSYVFSDVSAAFFSMAGQKLAAFPEVEFKAYDLDRPAIEQGFAADSFDFVIGSNVLHAVADVRATLRHLLTLLKPGGTLQFMDVATPHLWTESVFGLTSGWWHLRDRELRPLHPLMPRELWEKVLLETGFEEVASIPGLRGPMGEGQFGILARKSATLATLAMNGSAVLPETPATSSWLLFTDGTGVGEKLASRLAQAGMRCRIVKPGRAFEETSSDTFTLRPEMPEDWTRLLRLAQAEAPPDRIVYLWSLDESGITDPELMGTDALLHLAQALEQICPVAKLRFDLITRGAQAVGEHLTGVAVWQAPAIGIFRVILSEHSNFTCRGIDLPPEPDVRDAELLWGELQHTDLEREVAFRGESRYAQRFDRGFRVSEQWLPPSQPLRLQSQEPGVLDSLRLSPFNLPECGPDQVLIEVRAAGMNFRDVLKALALYPAETPDARIFGDEVGGIVTAVGGNVKHVAPGDPVFGLAVFGLATHTLARGADVRKIPAGLSFEESATIPVVFMTAWHALKNVARMRKGEVILVHAGAGGVGMAAIQIAHHLGAKVIATAGSPAKRQLLKTLGVEHVVDSRRADFADAVMTLTNRRGVDVVLNSLAGEAIPMGLACLAESGRFIEIGKRDIYQNARLPLWPLRRNASFHVVAMDAVFAGDESLTRDLLAKITGLVAKGALTALPFRGFPASRIDAAFRLMAQGKHMGKVVVTFADSLVPRRGEALVKKFEVSSDGAYIITGAFGGFGRVLAAWLADCGARHLVLTGRRGAATPDAVAFARRLEERGVTVTIVKADIGSPEDVRRVIAESQSSVPLKGVFHLAMVIDDAPMSALNRERLRAVIEPKAYGAWLLHEATRKLPLECFVMFSSVSSIFGNPAQANYSAANAFLDALAHERHLHGLPALTVNWGVLGGEGYVARNERVAEFLARQGTSALAPAEVIALLESMLTAGTTQAAAIRVDWAKWRQSFRGLQDNPLLQRVFVAGTESQESSGASDWRARIEAAAPGEREAIISQAVREVIAAVLRLKPERLRDDQPLTDLGLDSLMGVEIENSIESSIGVALPPTSLVRARTITQISSLISGHLGAGSKGNAAVPTVAMPAPVPSASADDVDLAAVSDEDLETLLGTGPEVTRAREPRPEPRMSDSVCPPAVMPS